MTNTDVKEDSEIDREIDASLHRGAGSSYLVKPKPAARLLGISDSTFYRGVNSLVIETVPYGGGLAVPRHVLRKLMKYGIPPIPSVVPAPPRPPSKRNRFPRKQVAAE